jgi:hypothetical protein
MHAGQRSHTPRRWHVAFFQTLGRPGYEAGDHERQTDPGGLLQGVQPANTYVLLTESISVALNTFRADTRLLAALAIPRPVWRQLQASFLAHFIALREEVPAKGAPDVRYQSTPWLEQHVGHQLLRR